jgi:N-acetylglucosamine malate deacetylase 1
LSTPVDVLLFGAHPDDLEWGAGGIMLLLQAKGVSFAMIDLTQGEMGSRGTIAERALESNAAAQFLGGVPRENLEMPDCGLADSPESRIKIAAAIRKYRPKLVLAPFWEDRHPDHSATGLMVRNSVLHCTLKKLDSPYAPHKPKAFLYFLLHHYAKPSFVVDISLVYEKKMELLRLHHTQFSKTATELGLVAQGMSDYLYGLESRDRFFGALIGAHHGEALVCPDPLAIGNINELLALT